MGIKVILRNEFVSAEDVNGNDIRCPRCNSNSLMLYGSSQVARTESLEDGKVSNVVLDEKSHVFEIESFECLGCKTRWYIQSREVARLERDNERLRQLLIEATGEDPYDVKAH